MAISEGRILEAALQVWNQRGYFRATIKRIAAAAEVAEATVQQRFGTKANLMNAALALEVGRFSDSLSRSGDLRTDLINLMKVYDYYLARRSRLFLDFVFEGPGSDELQSMASMLIQALDRSIAIVSYYQRSGELLGDDPREAALALIGPLILRRQRLQSGRSSFEAAGHLERFLLGWKASQQR
jgi:AcrR family transcriptional regulator